MSEIEQKYRALVERISGYPMTEAARERIMAEVEAIYRRERRAPRENSRRGLRNCATCRTLAVHGKAGTV